MAMNNENRKVAITAQIENDHDQQKSKLAMNKNRNQQ